MTSMMCRLGWGGVGQCILRCGYDVIKIVLEHDDIYGGTLRGGEEEGVRSNTKAIKPDFNCFKSQSTSNFARYRWKSGLSEQIRSIIDALY